MQKYEVAVVLHPDLEIDLDAPLERIHDIFKTIGAEVEKRDEWGKRKLAYPLQRQSFGVYVFYVVTCDPAKLGDLERALNLNEEVMRHLVVTYQAPEEKVETGEEQTPSEDEETTSKEKAAKKGE